jgi:predicted nuclease with TOPRIM domain
MSSTKAELVNCVRKYRTLDNRLKTLNQETQKLREDRKIIEMDMSDLLKTPEFATISKLEINDDNSYIKIQRPDMWSKPWSLSAKDLKTHLENFWRTNEPKTAETCYAYIVDKRKNDLVSTEFSFSRLGLKED